MSIDYSSLRFLVVDDNEPVREVLCGYLRKFGVQSIVEASDGQEATQILENKESGFDIILSDWEMPEKSGLRLLKFVKSEARFNGIKFIMVSSQAAMEDYRFSRETLERADAKLVKPFRGAELKSVIDKVARTISLCEKVI